MKLEKLSKKVFKRKMSLFEIYSILSGILVAIVSIYRGNGNYIPTLFGISLLILIGIFIRGKQKNIVLLSLISIIGWLLFFNATSPAFLTTTFSTGIDSIPPSTLAECQALEGVAIPITGECSLNMVEISGNAGEGYICCILDTCEGTWKRVWNSETKLYEKVCDVE